MLIPVENLTYIVINHQKGGRDDERRRREVEREERIRIREREREREREKGD